MNEIIHYGITGQKFGKYRIQNGEEKMNKVEMHKNICKELTDLYEKKNSDYGNSYAELRKDYPNSICIRLTDKLNRLKSLYDNNETHKIAESAEDTLKDIANYAIMELIERTYSCNNNDNNKYEYKNCLQVYYNEDTGFITFTFWDKYGEYHNNESYYACKESDWDEKVFCFSKVINRFLTYSYVDHKDSLMFSTDEFQEITTNASIQIARDILKYEKTLLYDMSDFMSKCAQILNKNRIILMNI